VTLNDAEFVREQYRDSSNFDARVELHTRFSTNPVPWPQWVFERLDLGPRADVLEVGCGPAWLWRQNDVPLGWRVVASDMSHGMACVAREHAGVHVVVSDAQSLPWANESFDLVIANHMLYHVPDLDAAFSEFVRVLRPGGRLFAATNGRAHFMEVRDVLDIHWRYVDMFGLESGPDKMRRHFDDVRVERYDDELLVPDVAPVLAYVKSVWTVDPDKERELVRVVEEEIARDGSFRITKDAGLITARRP